MRFLDIYSLGPQTINDHQIIREHIRALVIFGGDILGNGVGQRDSVGAPERELEDITAIGELAYKSDRHSGLVFFRGRLTTPLSLEAGMRKTFVCFDEKLLPHSAGQRHDVLTA